MKEIVLEIMSAGVDAAVITGLVLAVIVWAVIFGAPA